MLKITIFHQQIPGFLKDPVAPGPEDAAWWAAFISLESANSGCSPQRLFEPEKWVDYGGFVMVLHAFTMTNAGVLAWFQHQNWWFYCKDSDLTIKNDGVTIKNGGFYCKNIVVLSSTKVT